MLAYGAFFAHVCSQLAIQLDFCLWQIYNLVNNSLGVNS